MPAPYLPFAPGDQLPRMGLMALEEARWLEPGGLADVLAAKVAVRAAHPDAPSPPCPAARPPAPRRCGCWPRTPRRTTPCTTPWTAAA